MLPTLVKIRVHIHERVGKKREILTTEAPHASKKGQGSIFFLFFLFFKEKTEALSNLTQCMNQ